MTKTMKRKGVTLIELLIVVLILAALAAIAIPRISQSAQNANIRACETNIQVLNSAIEMYAADNDGTYPSALGDLNNATYFPDGLPTCPITGGAYTLDADDRVDQTAHAH